MKKQMAIVENDNFLLELLCDFFDESGKFDIVYCTADADACLQYHTTHPLDVVLLDISTDDGKYGGLKAGIRIKSEDPACKVILMTGLPEVSFLRQAKEGNIDSFLYKTDTIRHLYEAVEQTMEGRHIWPKKMPPLTETVELSERELEIARLICCRCMSRREVAETLQLSQNSVKTYTERIYQKLNVENTRELMRYILVNDLLLPDE